MALPLLLSFQDENPDWRQIESLIKANKKKEGQMERRIKEELCKNDKWKSKETQINIGYSYWVM